MWQSKRDGDNIFTQPNGTWIHHEGSECYSSKGMWQNFGYYVVRTSLAGYKTFEEAYPVTEELREIKVSYKKIK